MQNSRPEEESFDRNKRRINTPPIEPQEEANEFDDNFGNRVQNYNENGEYRFGNRKGSHGNGREHRFSKQSPYCKPYNGGQQDSVSRNKDSYNGYKNIGSGYGKQLGANNPRYGNAANRNHSTQHPGTFGNYENRGGFNRPNPAENHTRRTANTPEGHALPMQHQYRHRRNIEGTNPVGNTNFRRRYEESYSNRQYKNRLDNHRPSKTRNSPDSVQRRNDAVKKKMPRYLNLMKALHRLDFASPKILEQALRSGVISINGQTTDNLNVTIDKRNDVISAYGSELRIKQENIYVVMNKSRCVAGSYEKSGITVYQSFYYKHRWFFPVGCLDKTAAGIIILTTDKRHCEPQISPISTLEKEYYCKIHKVLSPDEVVGLQKFLDEVLHEDAEAFVVRRNARNMIISVTVTQTSPTKLRAALKRFGVEILSFNRRRVGVFTTDDLPAGAWRRLSQEEIDALNEFAELSARRKSALFGGKGSDADLRQEKASLSLKEKMQTIYRQIFKS